MAGSAVLEVRDVEKSFGSLRAVDSVSMEARKGRVTALLGPNGAGKTTLLRMIIGMLRPDQGRILYRLGKGESARPDPMRIGYLPEERGLYLDVPVRRMLLYFAALRGMPGAAARDAADRWLKRFDLADRAESEVRDLSKGNQQKIQFISAILHRPALAVLDEPFSGLDPINQDFFLELIRELASDGTAVLLSAHQMQLVERLADRVVMMRGGQVVSDGSVDELRGRWRTGRSLRLRLGAPMEADALLKVPGVRRVTPSGQRELNLELEPEASLSPLLATLARDAEVVGMESQNLTLHDLYLRMVNGTGEEGSTGQERSMGEGNGTEKELGA